MNARPHFQMFMASRWHACLIDTWLCQLPMPHAWHPNVGMDGSLVVAGSRGVSHQ